ncbi:MAG: hypothetical protein HY719_09475 [Planctomycetes bacterium]|nr:hypothetical protein [Planctomycetota bacterium]
MIGSPSSMKWLAHRGGVDRADDMPCPVVHYALEGNRNVANFLGHFGMKDLHGLVGFVDLVGFSTNVQGKSGKEIAEFLDPFLSRGFDAVTRNRGFVDKMIGDEIMFVVPDMLEDGGPGCLVHSAPILLLDLKRLQRDLGPHYKMRVGLGFGSLYISYFQGGGYGEWSFVGEAVHRAKRILALPELENPTSILCGVGFPNAQMSEANLRNKMGYLASGAWTWHKVDDPPALKGVSPGCLVIMHPAPAPQFVVGAGD